MPKSATKTAEPLKISAAAKRAYLRSPFHCPACRSENIEARAPQTDCSGAWQEVRCLGCGFRWNDVYQLKDIEVVRD